MRRILTLAFSSVVLCSAAVLGGCGAEEETSSVEPSAEAKKIDSGVQQGMRDFMQSKGASKSKGKAKAAPAPAPAPAPAGDAAPAPAGDAEEKPNP